MAVNQPGNFVNSCVNLGVKQFNYNGLVVQGYRKHAGSQHYGCIFTDGNVGVQHFHFCVCQFAGLDVFDDFRFVLHPTIGMNVVDIRVQEIGNRIQLFFLEPSEFGLVQVEDVSACLRYGRMLSITKRVNNKKKYYRTV